MSFSVGSARIASPLPRWTPTSLSFRKTGAPEEPTEVVLRRVKMNGIHGRAGSLMWMTSSLSETWLDQATPLAEAKKSGLRGGG